MAGPPKPPVGSRPGFESGGAVIKPVKSTGLQAIRRGIPDRHVSTPHSTNTTTTKNTPSWLNTAALTPAQMEAEALKEANDSISPQVSGIQGQQATYDAEQKAYQAAMTGFYSALAPYMAGIQGHVSDAYNSAATTMGDIGHGYAGVLGTAAAADNAETNAALARAGQAPIAAPGSGLTDAFNAEHGGIDGSSFAAQGAAKAADAAHQPAIWAASGRDNLTEAISKAVAGDKTYADQIKQVYAQVPALRQTILRQIQSAELDKQKLIDDEKNTAFNQAAKKVELGQSGARLTLAQQSAAFDQKYKIAGLTLRGQSLQLQAKKFAQSVYNSDRNFQLALERVGISNKRLQLSAIASEYKLSHGGYTPAQVNKFNGLLQQGLNGIIVTNNKDGTTTYTRTQKSPTGVGTISVPTSYTDFISQAVAHGIPPSIAIARADKFFPPADRPQGPDPLSGLLGTGGTNQTRSTYSAGKVTVAAGANRPGANLNPAIPALVAKISGVFGQPLTITTGTNHNQYVLNTHRVSDHWGGNAADIAFGHGSPGRPDPALTKLGQDALIAMGADPAWARKQTGGLFNLNTPQGRVQIIFNSMTGGNHYNHLHVGLSPSGGVSPSSAPPASQRDRPTPQYPRDDPYRNPHNHGRDPYVWDKAGKLWFWKDPKTGKWYDKLGHPATPPGRS